MAAENSTPSWSANTEYKTGSMLKTSTGNIYQVIAGSTGSSQPTSTSKGTIIMDGTVRIRVLGEYDYGWRVAGNSYSDGDIIIDDTFVVECIQGGTTDASNPSGPGKDAAWGDSDTMEDGSVIWKRITKTSDDGVWRNSNTPYPDGMVFLCDAGSPEGKVRLYESLPGISGDTEPTDTTGNNFLNGGVTLCFMSSENQGGNVNIDIPDTALVNAEDNDGITPDIANATPWKAGTGYNLGQCVISNGNIYSCVYDGRVTLFPKAVFENITTNIKTGVVFSFLAGTDVPTKQSFRPCQVIIKNCDAVTTVKEGATNYFGRAGNPDIEVKIVND